MADRKARERGIHRAELALAQYEDETRENVVDLLTDLMHFCHDNGITFESVLATAFMHREAEKG